MLKFIFKYRASVFGAFIVLIIGIAMLGFGVDLFTDQSRNTYAIKVNDQKITPQEYNSAKEAYSKQLRDQFGDAYQQVAKLVNIDKQIRDNLINQALIVQFASSLGMGAGKAEIVDRIKKYFPDDTKNAYAGFLTRTGRTPEEFEGALKNEIVNEDFQNILSDLLFVSKKEIEGKIKKDKEKFDLNYVKINASNVEEVKDPTDDVLLAYYNANATDFEEKERVSYEYVVFSPKDFEDEIQVEDNDIELNYTENISKYTTPASVTASFIIIPSSRGKEGAQKILDRAKAGEDFKAMIKKESTKAENTEPREVKKGDPEIEVEVEEALFNNEDTGIIGLIESKDYFTIAKVDKRQQEEVKPLESVREEIIKEIKGTLSPSFAKNKAQELKMLADEGKAIDENLNWKKVTLSSKGDMGTDFPMLTNKVLESNDGNNIVLEYGDVALFVKITEKLDNRILSFDELGDKKQEVIKQYKDKQLKENIRNFANNLIFKLNETSLEDAAKAQSLKLEKITAFEKKGGSSEKEGSVASFAEVKNAISKLNKKLDYTKEPVYHGDDIYVIQVSDVIEYSDKIEDKEIVEKEESLRNEQRTNAISNIIEALKESAQIELGSVANF